MFSIHPTEDSFTQRYIKKQHFDITTWSWSRRLSSAHRNWDNVHTVVVHLCGPKEGYIIMNLNLFGGHWLARGSMMIMLNIYITMTSQWARWRFKSPVSRLCTQPFVQAKLPVTGLCEGNVPVTGEFPAQRVSDAVNVSIQCWHHETWSQLHIEHCIIDQKPC